MKKTITIALSFILTALISNAQTSIIDFQELLLGSGNDTLEKYWNGSDMSGGFTSQNVYFKNKFTQGTGYFYWSGYAYSNTTDTINAGSLNYSAFANSDGTNKYGIAYGNNRKLTFKNPVKLASIKVCNTSYTALSLKFGDAYAKKFGGVSGNDEDSLKLIIKNYVGGSVVDSTVFMLADFRFQNNANDYISKGWNNIDLSNFKTGTDSISFSYQSSDFGQWGVNTPLYVAIDDLVFDILTNVEKNIITNSISIYPNPAYDYITIDGEIKSVDIYNLNGEIVLNSSDSKIYIGDLNSGIYIVKIIDNNGNVSNQKLAIQ